MELQSQLKEIRARGMGVPGISYDSPEVLAAFSQHYGIGFPLLSDTESATIQAYGILNTVAAESPDTIREDPNVCASTARWDTVEPGACQSGRSLRVR